MNNKNSSWRKFIAVALTVMLSPAAEADFAAGAKAYTENDYDRAFAEFEPLAQLGNAQAQYLLGLMYYNGQGAHQNLLLAYGWVKLSAEAGYAPAVTAESAFKKNMIAEEFEASSRLTQRFTRDAIDQRLMPKILPNCDYQNMSAPKPGKVETDIYPQSALMKGIEGSVLADFVVAADGSVRDVRIIRALPPDVFDSAVVEAAHAWKFTPAMRDGKAVTATATIMVIFKVSDAYEGEYGPLQTYVRKLKAEAERGDEVAQYIYATVLAGHPKYHKPWSEVLPWMLKAAQSGLAEAQFQVGESLLNGHGCEADSTKGMEWLKSAAQKDEPNAQVTLAKIALAAGPTFDPQKAIFWLERAVAKNNATATRYLAATLAATTIEQIRDPQRALSLVEKLEKKNSGDPTLLEIEAAARASTGDYQSAVATENKAIAKAKKLDWDTAAMQRRAATYDQKQAWHGDLLEF